MAFCGKCGAQLDDTSNFCVACGTPRGTAGADVGAGAPTGPMPSPSSVPPQGAPYAPPPSSAPPQGTAYAPPTSSVPPQNSTYAYATPINPANPGVADPRDIEENKVMAAVAYLLFFIPLLTGGYKTSPFLKFHANQGTVLFVSAAVYGIAYGILSAVLAFIPFLGWLVILLLGLASLWIPIFAVIGIINAVGGKMTPLPLIGHLQFVK